ncbi:bifunctional oligoribonuclease/PAP phosphatase NrnA [uncultured Phascolarctobacterium sp.]|uniref:DHH family phosphoesterase n=1 Tax=uncultured Phascolarctobacterium sp. TaxID=512296 RepID=UPI0025CB9D14|nr:bifunctional oligoribonuclease/PAP phosphatase NrnA [uncultured Phascolarctobacterium sp.]
MSKNLSLQETGELLLQAEKIVLCTHVSPDGDTLGSALGLARFLRQQGKEVTVYCDDQINAGFGFLPEIELVQRPSADVIVEADMLAVIDASSFDRIGLAATQVRYKTLLNIDHHISNTRFADYLYLDAEAAATGEVMCDLFVAMGWPLDYEMAVCFYTAITTDCGSFRYANTTPKTMRQAAMLLEYGVQSNEISDCLDMRSRSTVELLGKVLPSLTFERDGRIAYLTITNDLYDKSTNTDSFVSYPRYIEGVEIAVMFKAVEPEVTRVSMRSQSVDVAQVAVRFGGGGHLRAAGCTIYAPVEEARRQLLAELSKLI